MTTVVDVATYLIPWMTVGAAIRFLSCDKRLFRESEGDECTWRYLHSVVGLDPRTRGNGRRAHLVKKIVGTKRCRECGRPTKSRARAPSQCKVYFPLCRSCAEDVLGYRRLVTRKEVRLAIVEMKERYGKKGGKQPRILPCSLVPRAKVSATGAFLYWPSDFPGAFYSTHE